MQVKTKFAFELNCSDRSARRTHEKYARDIDGRSVCDREVIRAWGRALVRLHTYDSLVADHIPVSYMQYNYNRVCCCVRTYIG